MLGNRVVVAPPHVHDDIILGEAIRVQGDGGAGEQHLTYEAPEFGGLIWHRLRGLLSPRHHPSSGEGYAVPRDEVALPQSGEECDRCLAFGVQ